MTAASPQKSVSGGQHPNSRKLAINFLLLTAGEFTAKLLTFCAFFYLARVLGAERYGNLEFTLAVMTFFTLPADMGLGGYGARELAKGNRDSTLLLREIVGMRIVLAAVSFLMLAIMLVILPKSLEVKLLLGAYGFTLLGNPLLLQWLFQAYDQMHWVAIASILRQGVFAGLLFLFFRPQSPLLMLGVFECVAVGAVCLFCLVIARLQPQIRLERPRFDFVRMKAHLRQAVPIGATELAWAFMWYFATVMLGLVFSDSSLGWFGASHRMLMALHTFVWLYFFNLLPSISRCVAEPRDRLLGLMYRSVNVAAWSSIFVALVMTILAREALTIAYGPSFAAAAGLFELMVWMLPLAMLSGHYRYILIAYEQQDSLLRCTIVSAAVAVLLGFLLVPGLGALGAVWALLCANLVNFALVYRAVRRLVTEVPFHQQLTRPLLALSAGVVVYLVCSRFNPWVSASAASVTYGLVLVVSQGRQVLSLVRLLTRTASPAVRESLAG